MCLYFSLVFLRRAHFCCCMCSFQLPVSLLMKKVPSNMFFLCLALSYGLISALLCLVTSFNGLIMGRLCLGIAESGVYSGALLLISQYFTREEMAGKIASMRSALGCAFVCFFIVFSFVFALLRCFYVAVGCSCGFGLCCASVQHIRHAGQPDGRHFRILFAATRRHRWNER